MELTTPENAKVKNTSYTLTHPSFCGMVLKHRDFATKLNFYSMVE
jgi:hypothetical protein